MKRFSISIIPMKMKIMKTIFKETMMLTKAWQYLKTYQRHMKINLPQDLLYLKISLVIPYQQANYFSLLSPQRIIYPQLSRKELIWTSKSKANLNRNSRSFRKDFNPRNFSKLWIIFLRLLTLMYQIISKGTYPLESFNISKKENRRIKESFLVHQEIEESLNTKTFQGNWVRMSLIK
jgi:hypothetical protein